MLNYVRYSHKVNFSSAESNQLREYLTKLKVINPPRYMYKRAMTAGYHMEQSDVLPPPPVKFERAQNTFIACYQSIFETSF